MHPIGNPPIGSSQTGALLCIHRIINKKLLITPPGGVICQSIPPPCLQKTNGGVSNGVAATHQIGSMEMKPQSHRSICGQSHPGVSAPPFVYVAGLQRGLQIDVSGGSSAVHIYFMMAPSAVFLSDNIKGWLAPHWQSPHWFFSDWSPSVYPQHYR